MQHLIFLTKPRRSRLLALLPLALFACSACGIIVFALQGSLIGVALAALIPGLGAIWLLIPSRGPGDD